MSKPRKMTVEERVVRLEKMVRLLAGGTLDSVKYKKASELVQELQAMKNQGYSQNDPEVVKLLKEFERVRRSM